MERSQKSKIRIAILLNALILPGLGHIYAGYRVRGTLLAIASAFFVIAPMVKYMFIISNTLAIVKYKTANIAPALAELSSTAWPQMQNAVYLAIGGIIIVWVFGIVDLFFKSGGFYGMSKQ